MTVLETIHQHRSIRKYKPDPVPDELIREILEAGIRTSSSANMNTYSIIVTRDRKVRVKLSIPNRKQSMVLDAPVLLTFCADFNRMRKWLKLNNAPDGFDCFRSFIVGAIDAILVSQTVALAAESKGLGICYLGSTLSNCDQIGKVLELPPSVVPVVGYSLGYPDENPDLRDRLPYEGLVHEETYQDYTDDQIINIYQEREVAGWERYMNNPDRRRQIEESGVENLAQVYTKLRYTRETYQRIARRILDYLEAQDFMNQ